MSEPKPNRMTPPASGGDINIKIPTHVKHAVTVSIHLKPDKTNDAAARRGGRRVPASYQTRDRRLQPNEPITDTVGGAKY